DAATGRFVTRVTGTGPRFLVDSRRIVTRLLTDVKVWDVTDSQLLVSLGAPGDTYGYLGTSPDGRHLAAATSDGAIRLWDAPPEGEQPGEETRVLRGASGPLVAVAFRPDGRQMVAASADGTARVWDVASGSQRLVLLGHDGLVIDAAYSPDGRLIATAGV